MSGAATPRWISSDVNDAPTELDSSSTALTAGSVAYPPDTRACAKRRAHSTRVAADGLMPPLAVLLRGLSLPRALCAVRCAAGSPCPVQPQACGCHRLCLPQ